MSPAPREPGSIDAMIKKRQAEDRIKDEAERKKRNKLIGILTRVAVVVVGVLVGAAAVFWYLDSRKGCGATEIRRKALATIIEQGDAENGTLIKERFPDKKAFRCGDTAGPRGILVAVDEDSGDAIIWFVDVNGTAFNVNLLSVSWTPKLAAGPDLSKVQLAKVAK